MAGEFEIKQQFDKILNEYKPELKKRIEIALDKSSKKMKSKLESAAPHDSNSKTLPSFRDSFHIEKYPRARYIGNKKTVARAQKFAHQKGGIPLMNLLEFAHGRKYSFADKVVNQNQNIILQDFINEIKK